MNLTTLSIWGKTHIMWVKIFLLGLLVAATIGATWKITSWKYEAQISKLLADFAQAETKAEKKARSEEQQNSQRFEKAINDAITLNKKLAADAVVLRRQSDSLRNTLADAEQRFATASASAQLEYVTTLGAVHGECNQRYSELATKATGHANDVQTLINAWPRNETKDKH